MNRSEGPSGAANRAALRARLRPLLPSPVESHNFTAASNAVLAILLLVVSGLKQGPGGVVAGCLLAAAGAAAVVCQFRMAHWRKRAPADRQPRSLAVTWFWQLGAIGAFIAAILVVSASAASDAGPGWVGIVMALFAIIMAGIGMWECHRALRMIERLVIKEAAPPDKPPVGDAG